MPAFGRNYCFHQHGWSRDAGKLWGWKREGAGHSGEREKGGKGSARTGSAIYLSDKGSKHLWNADKLISDHTTQLRRRQPAVFMLAAVITKVSRKMVVYGYLNTQIQRNAAIKQFVCLCKWPRNESSKTCDRLVILCWMDYIMILIFF